MRYLKGQKDKGILYHINLPFSELVEAAEDSNLYPKYAEANKATPEAANTPAKKTRMNKFSLIVIVLENVSLSLFSMAVILSSLPSESEDSELGGGVDFTFIIISLGVFKL